MTKINNTFKSYINEVDLSNTIAGGIAAIFLLSDKSSKLERVIKLKCPSLPSNNFLVTEVGDTIYIKVLHSNERAVHIGTFFSIQVGKEIDEQFITAEVDKDIATITLPFK